MEVEGYVKVEASPLRASKDHVGNNGSNMIEERGGRATMLVACGTGEDGKS